MLLAQLKPKSLERLNPSAVCSSFIDQSPTTNRRDPVTQFEIRLEEPDPDDPTPLARIVVGDFTEHFVVAPISTNMHVRALPYLWERELRRLVAGSPAVALPTQPGRAWVLYREGDDIFIQDQLVLTEESGDDIALVAAPRRQPRPRAVVSEEGDPISEWRTTVQAVHQFLRGAL